ncbi:Hypothetical predicted protein [Podarcis lilfordi]|uniref:Uncharacterized protein n=1 Tax=Podarcis lilfordi TaxID=74358 RepID=A0AA35PFY0_9SAUR|nr:Hypothetical predicted protein [Podarcis lilfordi]
MRNRVMVRIAHPAERPRPSQSEAARSQSDSALCAELSAGRVLVSEALLLQAEGEAGESRGRRRWPHFLPFGRSAFSLSERKVEESAVAQVARRLEEDACEILSRRRREVALRLVPGGK